MDKLIRPALEKGVLLFNILVQVWSGKASAILKVVPSGNGLEAWRLFCKEYEPNNSARCAAMLTGLLSPVWDPTVDWVDQWLAWEHAVAQYEEASGTRLGDGVKCATVARWCPPD
eukprot:15917545-Heterocapsa_arctica.AAC.1